MTVDETRLESDIFTQVRDMVMADRGRSPASLIAWARDYARARLGTHRLSKREVRLVDGAVHNGIAVAQKAIDAASAAPGTHAPSDVIDETLDRLRAALRGRGAS